MSSHDPYGRTQAEIEADARIMLAKLRNPRFKTVTVDNHTFIPMAVPLRRMIDDGYAIHLAGDDCDSVTLRVDWRATIDSFAGLGCRYRTT